MQIESEVAKERYEKCSGEGTLSPQHKKITNNEQHDGEKYQTIQHNIDRKDTLNVSGMQAASGKHI